MKYYFILGKNPELSAAEIVAVLDAENIEYKIDIFHKNILIIDTVKKTDAEKLCDRLGGTVKIGQILGGIENLNDLSRAFFELIKFKQEKFFFGFSLYALTHGIHINKEVKKIYATGLDIKRMLREDHQITSRLVSSRETELSSVIVRKNKLIAGGADICLFFTADNILIGQTLAAQKFEEYGARDYGRPSRDDLAGMLPPKLAKIMINLAQLKPAATILDPFCGSGTILQEALLLGYKNLIGSDISPKAIADTKDNLDWLKTNFPILQPPLAEATSVGGGQFSNIPLYQSDIKAISKQIKPKSINAVITEPFLGAPLRGHETREQLIQTLKDLEKLYITAFLEMAKILKPGAKIVIVFPVYIYRNEKLSLNIDSDLIKIGFKFSQNKMPLYYFREGQHVYRQIRVLTF